MFSGVSSREELHQNIKALEEPLTCDADYRKSVALKMDGMYDRLCTGCSYCQGCPKEIEISKRIWGRKFPVSPVKSARGNVPSI